MCRVIMVNRADFRAYDKQYGILKLMNHLEKECGGHGNGYALIKDGKIIETRKGQGLTNEEIYGRISVLKWDYLVYHTRINSMGGRGDANCHPFVQDNDCLAMNGTEHSLRTMSDAFGRTDTECIFKNMAGLGLEQTTRALVEFGSVFVGCAGGKPFVVKAGGTLHRWNGGDKSFHASTFPVGVKNVKDLPVGYIWEDGKENLQFVKKTHSGYGGYGYGNYGYGYTRSLWDDYEYYGKSSKKSTTKTSSATTAKSSKPNNNTTQGTEIKQTATSNGTVVELKPAAKTTTAKKNNETGSWLKTYGLGEAAGYEDGYSDGYQEGFGEGREYERNRANGSCDPDDDEYDGTFSDGYYMGYNDALAGIPMDIDVNNVSELVKKKADPSSDYNVGFVDGRDAGYEEGFEAGYTEAEEKLGLKALEQED